MEINRRDNLNIEHIDKIAINVSHVFKTFRIPHERRNTVYQHISGLINWGSFSYEAFTALKDINFTVKNGESFGIIGTNGSGKSTLLKILAGVLYPDTGTVQVNGKIAPFLELGVGFQPDLTAKENIFLYGSIMGLSKKVIRAKYESILDFAELKKFENMKLKNFSSGMVVRLAFSTAIQTDPDILLVDEVLSVGDESFQRKCYEKIFEFKEKGKTIIFVSHGLDSVRQLCERCLLLDSGQVLSIGDSGNVVEDFRARMYIKDEIRLKDSHKKIINQLIPSEEIKEVLIETNESVSFDRKNRWGTREVEIIDVQFLNENNEEQYVFKTGEPLVIRIEFFAKIKIENPIFGIAIFRDEGVHIIGPNTKNSDYPIEFIKGRGMITYKIISIPFLDGSYKLSVCVCDQNFLNIYDMQDRLYSFKVTHGKIKDNFGILYIPCEWKLN